MTTTTAMIIPTTVIKPTTTTTMATALLMVLMINYLHFHHPTTTSAATATTSTSGANILGAVGAHQLQSSPPLQVDRPSLGPNSESFSLEQPTGDLKNLDKAGPKLELAAAVETAMKLEDKNYPPNLVSEPTRVIIRKQQTRSEIPKVVKQSNTRRRRKRSISETDLGNLGTFLYKDLTLQEAQPNPINSQQATLKPIDIVKHNHHHHHQHHHNHRHHHRNQDNNDGKDYKNSDQPDHRLGHQPEQLRHGPDQQKERHKRHHPGGGDSYFGTADRPVVETRKGLVRGITQKLFTGKFVDAFLGIPYAQPPLGKYRFRHPQPVNPWLHELDASRMSNSCYQINDTFFGASFLGTSIWNANTPLSEDCLYLNIWTPFGVANTSLVPPPIANQQQQRQSQYSWSSSSHHQQQQRPSTAASKTKLRPVLVWIFGGGFYSGTSSLTLYEGGVLASEEDIIVVSMNYRVSALGFLYFGRPDAPGNAGLFDQLMALQWINDNIDQFGGDPNRVTIFGESAGAVSVAFHLLSPLSRNLFSQAILESGAATCPWGYKHSGEIIANGLQLASLLNCPSSESNLTAVVDCLLHADPMAMVSQDVGQSKTILNFPFVPVVDGSFLVETPEESLMKSNFKRANILLGSNNDEGNSFLIYLPEFSHCPSISSPSTTSTSSSSSSTSDNNNNNNNEPSSAGAQSDQKQQEQQDEASAAGQHHLAAINLRQQHPVESLDLRLVSISELQQLDLTSAPRAEPLLAANQANDVAANDGGSGDFSAEATEQVQFSSSNLNQNNDSNPKPCTPNEYLQLSREDFLRVLREELNPYAVHPIGKEAIVFEYSNWNNPHDSVSNYDALDKIVGDYYFTCHVNEFAQRYASAGNAVYMYYFKQRSSMSPWPKWMGVLHADEINFVFGEPLNQNYNYTTKEIELSKRMMKYWANFAKFGNPTKLGENASMVEKWPKYSDKKQYFELHSDSMRIGRGPRAKQCAFWANYLPNLIYSFDRRWRNQRAAASMSQQQRAAAAASASGADAPTTAAAAAAPPATTPANLANTQTTPPARDTSSLSFFNQQQPSATKTTGATATTAMTRRPIASAQPSNYDRVGSGRINTPRPLPQRDHQQSIGLHHHGSRLSGMVGASTLEAGPFGQQQASGGAGQQAAAAAESSTDQQTSAFDLAQSAAARVTGSAAAALAAARFKMLRSNTLAAAFGQRQPTLDQTAEQGGVSTATPVNLLATRMRDERVISSTQSRPSAAASRPS